MTDKNDKWFWHRLAIAVQLAFAQASEAGMRDLCRFCELSGLDTFITELRDKT